MMERLSTEFWIAALFILQFLWVVFLYFLVKRMNRMSAQFRSQPSLPDFDDAADQAAKQAAAGTGKQVIQMMDPYLEEARETARQFDRQIREKRQLLKQLNQSLDDRIINLNLLLSRAKTQHEKIMADIRSDQTPPPAAQTIPPPRMAAPQAEFHQQNQVIQMFGQGKDPDEIARTLGIPQGEVNLVIELKKKFLEMEQGSQ